MTANRDGNEWNRRRFLAMAGVTAGAGMLAGCGGLANQEFIADTVVLPAADQEELGFTSLVEETDRREYSRSVAGQDVNATVESAISVYAQTEFEVDFGDSGGPLLFRFDGGEDGLFAEVSEKLAAPASAFGVVGGPLANVNPNIGTEQLVPAFLTVVIGGVGKIEGAVVAGLMLGTLQVLLIQTGNAAWSQVGIYALAALVLLVRPQGLLGSEVDVS